MICAPACNKAVVAAVVTNQPAAKRFESALIISGRFLYFSGNYLQLKRSDENLFKRLEERKAAGTYRTLKPGNSLVDFCSNDYLGFARSLILKQKIDNELKTLPYALNGSTGSRLISGNSVYTEIAEKQIATFHNADAGLLFNSGYDANLGLFSSVPQRGDTIIIDELVHASIIDGSRLSFANKYNFRHNDLDSLEDKLKQAKGNCYVAIESVYSMDGDTPPITAILELTEKYGAHLIVDEAHAIGIYKKGLVSEFGLEDRVFARLITFGKGLGCHGAIVLGSAVLREYLINFARSFIYTTAVPIHAIASVMMAYELMEYSYEQIDQLKQKIALFNQGIAQIESYPLLKSDSPIQCIVLKSNEKAKEAAAHLQRSGFDVRAILNPTVQQGTERIRICLHTFNTNEEINRLTAAINNFIHV